MQDITKIPRMVSHDHKEDKEKHISYIIEAAVERHKMGNLASANLIYEEIRKFDPNNVVVLQLSGVLASQVRQFDTALNFLSKAISLNPAYAQAYNNRGNVLKALGRFKEALLDYGEAILLKPDYFEAYNNKGILLREIGHFEEAISDYNKAISLRPNSETAYNNRGNVFRELGLYEKAFLDYEKALSLNKDYPEAYNNLALALSDVGNFDEALAIYDQVLMRNEVYPEALNNRGNVLKELQRFDDALLNYTRAISVKPDYAEAFNNRGNTYKDLGQIKKALSDYYTAVRLKPYYADAHRQISTLRKYHKKDPHFFQMKRLISDRALPDEERCQLYFALAKASEDQGNYFDAFGYLKKGGDLRKSLLSYRIEDDKHYFNCIKKNAAKISKHTVKHFDTRITPILIIGMPRSGTTLVEQILSAHSAVCGGGELPFWGIYGKRIIEGKVSISDRAVQEIREKYIKVLQRLSKRHLFITDKTPTNFLSLGLILTAFPEAKIINTKRAAPAVCWSNYKHYFSTKALGYSYNLLDTVKFFRMYEDLMAFWRDCYKDRIYTLSYEKLTMDPEEQIRNLTKFLGLEWERACLAPHKNKRVVRTSSQRQITQPIYQGSSDAWQDYEPYILGVFDDILDQRG